jgi:hypothetical protein
VSFVETRERRRFGVSVIVVVLEDRTVCVQCGTARYSLGETSL